MRYIAVVEADAYGLPLYGAPFDAGGVGFFAVANVAEAAEIRHMGAGWPIWSPESVLTQELSRLIDHDLTATISTATEAEAPNRLGAQRGVRLKVRLKVDTGMGRLGVWHSEALAYSIPFAHSHGCGGNLRILGADLNRTFADDSGSGSYRFGKGRYPRTDHSRRRSAGRKLSATRQPVQRRARWPAGGVQPSKFGTGRIHVEPDSFPHTRGPRQITAQEDRHQL